MKRRIAISAGHSNVEGKDQGAQSNEYSEGKETVAFRNLLIEALNKLNVKASIDPDEFVTSQTVELFKRYFSHDDILIDIYFNASDNISATGVECIVPLNYSTFEYMLATDLCSTIASTLNIRKRGVITEAQSARNKLVWMSMNAETVIIELCFLSNFKDMLNYNQYKDKCVNAIANLLLNYKTL